MISYPTDKWMCAELLCEGIFVADFIIRVRVTKYSNIEKMWFLQENFMLLKWILLIISSIPYSMIFQFFGEIQSTKLIGLRFLKLLRIYQILIFFDNIELVTKEKISKLSIYKIILLILVIIHFSAMLWLFDCNNQNNSCFINDTTDFNAYIFAIFWASETLTGIVLTKLSQNTTNQRAITFFIIVISIILYCSLFCILVIYLKKMNAKRIERSNHKFIVRN